MPPNNTPELYGGQQEPDRPFSQSTRLDRIEAKIDKLSDAMVAIARTEEKIINMESKYSAQYDRQNAFSVKLDNIDKKVEDNARTVQTINKLFWILIVACGSAIITQIWTM